jgi:membrane magnesium transporter 1
METLLALFLGTLGASLNAPALKEITWAAEMKTRYAPSLEGHYGRMKLTEYNSGRGKR